MNEPASELAAKVAFLRQPASYPERPYRVEAVETHMSWVFLLEQFVYKLKKPVCLDCFDCRTLGLRHELCQEELRLNRRLAPGVYLDLVPLTLDEQQHFDLDGSGVVVDWLVKMARLAADRMLDYAILHQSVSNDDLLRVARRMTRFYASLLAEPIDLAAYTGMLERKVKRNQAELDDEQYQLPQALAICGGQLMTLRSIAGLLDDRLKAGKIVEGHGDLRPEHVYLGPELAIIDCLEFSRDLRITDVADELGFLALECERLGAPAAGQTLLDYYSALSGDTPARMLIDFYQSCRAGTRATIAARHLQEEKFRHSPHWLAKARHYLRLAEEHLARCGKPP
jgi:aminoglycoside phosphotransferase family enzyme